MPATLPNENPLSYLGVRAETPPNTIVTQIDPTTNDRDEVGTFRVNEATGNSFQLVRYLNGLPIWQDVAGTGDSPISPFVVGPTGQAGYQTVQSAITAAAAAGGGTIYVQPGTYTENLTLSSGVYIAGSIDFNTTIVGVHTPPAAGDFAFQNITLQSATHIFNSAVAGTANLSIEQCIVRITNGYLFNLLNWTGNLSVFDSSSISTNDGFVNNTGGSLITVISGDVGDGVGNAAVIAGSCRFRGVDVNCPVTFQGAGTADIVNSVFFHTVTTAATATVLIADSVFSTGADSAISHGSASPLTLGNVIINSANVSAIAGAGAGALSLESVTFENSQTVAGTLTLSGASVFKSGSLQVVVGTNVAGASPQIVNARQGQVAFTDVINTGAYGTLTVTDSFVAATSHIMATASCTTVNSALVVAEVTPGAGSFACRILNAGAANTAADILVTFFVLD